MKKLSIYFKRSTENFEEVFYLSIIGSVSTFHFLIFSWVICNDESEISVKHLNIFTGIHITINLLENPRSSYSNMLEKTKIEFFVFP